MPGELVTSDLSAVRSPWTPVSQTRPASCLTHARSNNFRHSRSVSDLHVNNLAHARSVSARDFSHLRNMPWQHRPKSTPVTRNPHCLMAHHSQKVTIPETGIFPGHTECERVRQLEHEPTRQHKFRSHLPLKRSKPLSWQKSSDAPVTQLQLGPGYILSKTRSSSHVTLRDEFFEPPVVESSRNKMDGDAVRDSVCEQLQQQISDLMLRLEDERLSHKQAKHKAKQDLRDKIDHMNLQFQDQIRDLKAEHQEEMLQQKQRIQAEHTQVQNTLENQISRMAKEIEFLQSAFETYKESLHTEATQKRSSKENERKLMSAEDEQQAVHEIKCKLIQEWNLERTNLIKEHQKAIEAVRRENKQEMDGLIHRFSNVATDLEKLKETTALLEECQSELQALRDSYSTACQQLTSVTSQLTDAKVRLVDFEERFEDKVSQVDAKYRDRLEELMAQNIELKRLFVQKCGELFDEKANSHYKRAQRTKSATEALQSQVKAKQSSNLSIPLAGPRHKVKVSESRPLSAPGAGDDDRAALETVGNPDLQH